MKLLMTGLFLFSTSIFAKDMMRGPSSFIMKEEASKSSQTNCYSNCGESCHILTGSKNTKFMKSEAKKLCESKVAKVQCFEQNSENDLLHLEMCSNQFDEAEEGISASIDIEIDSMLKLSE